MVDRWRFHGRKFRPSGKEYAEGELVDCKTAKRGFSPSREPDTTKYEYLGTDKTDFAKGNELESLYPAFSHSEMFKCKFL